MAKNYDTFNFKKRRDLENRLITASLRLVLETEWNEISLGDIANAAKIQLIEAHKIFPSKNAILKAFNKQIDSEVLPKDPTFSSNSTIRDQLFELIMLRFDVLSREKKAISRIFRSTIGRDPVTSFIGLGNAWVSMKNTLEIVGISTSSPLGQLKVNGLLAIYLKSMCSWLKDDSSDLSKTMAELDKNLLRAETLLHSLSSENVKNDISNSN